MVRRKGTCTKYLAEAMSHMSIKKISLFVILAAVLMIMSISTPAMAQQVFDPSAYASSGMVNGPMYVDSQGNYYATPGPDLTATYGPY